MKKILITGANSYIGTSFERYMSQWPDAYQVDTVDMVDGSWREKSFAGYDSVFHVAGIAHINTKKLDQQARDKYWKVNALLPIEVAKKAKAEGVGQFIFLSSMSVYGKNGSIKHPVVITRDTKPAPKDIYGQSKLKAEEGILPLNDGFFRVCILRPPMIYGPGCKGNYQTLARIARAFPFFPYVDNQRSMLYIGNLLEFVRLIVSKEDFGIFLPQNGEFSNTSLVVKEIAAAHGKRMILLKGFGWLIILAGVFGDFATKAFGSLVVDQSLSEYSQPYNMVSLAESIRETETHPGADAA